MSRKTDRLPGTQTGQLSMTKDCMTGSAAAWAIPQALLTKRDSRIQAVGTARCKAAFDDFANKSFKMEMII
jgi:hypothetical protein